MIKSHNLINNLNLEDPEKVKNRTLSQINKTAESTTTIFNICERIIDQIPRKIMAAEMNEKLWCDIDIPRMVSKKELVFNLSRPVRWSFNSYPCYWIVKQVLLVKNGFIEKLMNKIISDNYKCVIIKWSSRFALRIAWCDDNSYINNFN